MSDTGAANDYEAVNNRLHAANSIVAFQTDDFPISISLAGCEFSFLEKNAARL